MLNLNLRFCLLKFSNDDQETASWVPIWSSAVPQLSAVNIQLPGDSSSKTRHSSGAVVTDGLTDSSFLEYLICHVS